MLVRHMKDSDYKSVTRWLDLRGLDLKTEKSELAYIIPGVCAAQLIKAENGVGIFDSLITNPLVSAKTRNKALNSLVEYMLSDAAKHSISRIIALTSDNNTFKRAELHGFEHQYLYVLTYKDKSCLS